MPLIKSASKEAISKNISTESKTKPHDQAVAIALNVADKAKSRKSRLGALLDKHMGEGDK